MNKNVLRMGFAEVSGRGVAGGNDGFWGSEPRDHWI